MKQKESYSKNMAKMLSDFAEKTSSKKDFENLCLAQIALALGVIVDILEGRNEDGSEKTTGDVQP